MRTLLVLLILIVNLNSALANNSNKDLEVARNYLNTILTNDYDSILNFISDKKLTANPHQTMWEKIQQMEKAGILTAESKSQLISDLKGQDLSETDLKDITNKEYVSYMLIEMFKLQEAGYSNLTSLKIQHTSTQESDDVTHFIFLAEGELIMEDGSDDVVKVSDYKLVSVKNGSVIIPSKVLFLTRAFVGVFGN